MKNISAICIFCLLLLTANSCKNFVEGYDISPNSPSDVGLDVLLSGVQLATISNFTTNLARTPGVLTQQLKGVQFQFEDTEEYVIREETLDNEFQQIYAGSLLNAQILIDKAGDGSKHYRGIARTLKAMNLALATDGWGDVPNSEALRGGDSPDNFNPAYDTQESIYADIIASLDQAVADLSSAEADNVFLPGANDLMFGGDVDKWRNVARVLKARLANHLSKRNAAGSATQALAALDAAFADGFNNADDNMMVLTGEAGNEWNQWYAFEQQRAGYIIINPFFLGKLAGDPRLEVYTKLNNAGVRIVGDYYGGKTSPLPLVTYYEAKFIEAEAALRANDPARAAAAYNDAIKANLAELDADDPAYIAANANETAATITLEKIMGQKYIAMFTQPEVWNDWRRTGFPALTPNPDGNVNAIPRRYPTVQTERLYNTKATVVTDLLSKVWWDE